MLDLQRMDQISIDALVLKRSESQFAPDMQEQKRRLSDAVEGRRVLVVGGGGTIGSATTMLLAQLSPACLDVVDQSENYLAELVRDLRGRPSGLSVEHFRTLPLDYGSPVMGRFLSDTKPYDLVLNFAALKHVRSEKDVYSLLQMLDTNVVRHIRFRKWLRDFGHGKRYFAVSTDKAANPTSLMGASKRLMEDVVFDPSLSSGGVAVSARFANVAFSNGSLLQAFLMRLAKGQPLAVPKDTRRYFVSQRESGEICLLASLLGGNSQVLFPLLDPVTELQSLEEVATRVLAHAGFIAEPFDNEVGARQAVGALSANGRWPLLLTNLDTSGEKAYEEFIGDGEMAADSGMKTLGAVLHVPSNALSAGLADLLEQAVSSVDQPINKQRIVDAITSVIPNFSHRETGKSLDDRL